jgi:hypothetical protein
MPKKKDKKRKKDGKGKKDKKGKKNRPSVQDEPTYEALRSSGASKGKAARIANAEADGGKPAKKGGKAPAYEDQTKAQLQKKASDVGISGRSRMTKGELIDALRNH